MTVDYPYYRAGSQPEIKHTWYGVIREHGRTLFICEHENHTAEEARECSKDALDKVRSTDELPEDWNVYRPGKLSHVRCRQPGPLALKWFNAGYEAGMNERMM